jgi:lipoate-protein ligase A
MAVDAILFDMFAQSEIDLAAVLRLYTWKRPAITIGYNQDPDRILDKSRVEENLPVIRRITGGRAIYHDKSEITFSLTADSSRLPVPTSTLSTTNTMISQALVEILNELGIPAAWMRHSDKLSRGVLKDQKPACFDSISKYEIVSDGRKIVGGAQRRNGGCFIFQGSIKVNGVAGHASIGQSHQSELIVNQEERMIQISDMKKVFGDFFSRAFGMKFEISNFPEKVKEKALSAAKKDVKYQSNFK